MYATCNPELNYPADMTSRPSAVARRRQREQEILDATRRLFDESGVRDAQIEDIARAAGINRAIIYRHFSGKEELFALTVERYIEEILERLLAARAGRRTPTTRLTAVVEAFADYGMEYPAFVDCALTLLRKPGPELLDQVSEAALFRLGRGIVACLKVFQDVLEEGVAAGEFKLDEPDLSANFMYASALGALQLTRIGMMVHEVSPGVPRMTAVTEAQVRDMMVKSALALAKNG